MTRPGALTLGRLLAPVLKVPERLAGLGPVLDITCDSRKAGPGTLFVALRGEKVDGHRYVGDAVDRGCLAAVIEEDLEEVPTIPVFRVDDTHRAYGLLAAEFFGRPATEMRLIGLTGTNGKTTTAWMIEELVRAGGGSPGVIGTVNYRYRGTGGEMVEHAAPLTTPEPMLLQGLLREMRDGGVTHVIMEASSHALVQQRLAGLEFDVAVFTNLSRDHLDYHGSMEEYFAAKLLLFEKYLRSDGTAVVVTGRSGETGIDWGERVVERMRNGGLLPWPGRKGSGIFITCGLRGDSDVRAGRIVQDIDGMSCLLSCGAENVEVRSGLIGVHNAVNMAAAAGVGLALGMEWKTIGLGLARIGQVPGRLERIEKPAGLSGQAFPRIFVDYAHTPDALENVLRALRPVTRGRLVCVFGCGGDRDQGKRPVMGAVAARLADLVLLTSDNPRGEEPGKILADIEAGLAGMDVEKREMRTFFKSSGNRKGYLVEPDRRRAIRLACAGAAEGDVVLIAGKGHETYQEKQGSRIFFDDRVEARSSFLAWTPERLAEATQGRLVRGDEKIFCNAISTDTRTINPGDVFLALRGERFDGHDYIETAVEKGAAALVVERDPGAAAGEAAVVVVDDTLRALGGLARYRRRLLGDDLRVIAITGSSGKTTVKEMTAAIFEAAYERIAGTPVLKTRGNLNNLVGLPLTLLGVNGGHRVAVLEMGMNRPGEIRRLAGIAEPDVGCIVNVQTAHLEGLGSIEGVAAAKGELFASMAGRGVLVVNCDDPHVRRLGGEHGNHVIGFAVTPHGRRFDPLVRATRITSLGERGMRFTLHIGGWHHRFTVAAAGEHNVANCAAAAALATAAGVAPEVIVRGLSRYTPADKRLEITRLPGGLNVVNDAYNANPSSMAAALKTVIGFGEGCRRVALLGDMLELGADAVRAHRETGKLVARLGYDYLGVTGSFAPRIAEGAMNGGMDASRIGLCEDRETLAGWVAGLVAAGKIGPGDWLLLKGSRGMGMELVLRDLDRRLKPERN
ncbi:MAG: bifunctional UDP-N-acetylmuramoyl-L-alanyl-D-glutamate--2,6-diaminopimel ate ligase MurE/UDP-N-acetylmuramoyl-tripeptide--D-alanyl-D-alanine ligase MurF [Desulfobulbaceae bacterium]